MDRRNALKKISLSFGYMVAAPTAFSILQSCIQNDQLAWNPKFFSEKEAIIVQNLIDQILPVTKGSPGALEVNVHKFIDAYFKEVVTPEQQNSFKKGIKLILEQLENSTEKTDKQEYNQLLTKFLKAKPKEKSAFKNKEEDELIYHTLTDLRNKSVWAFKTSKEIGKNILIYDPIPGVQIGCMPLKEATGGKDWTFMN